MDYPTIEEVQHQKGNVLNIGRSRMRAIYYRPIPQEDGSVDWMPTNPLPADPYNVAVYFRKGFKAKAPDGEQREDGLIKCPLCDFKAQSAFGLASHLRKHNKEKKE